MIERQNTEFKLLWKDEYLKWICGFANAQGGRILIGVDDFGKPVGLNNLSQLLEEIPNKSVSHLGLVVDVFVKAKSKRPYLEIVIHSSSVPISYHGTYHYRSGSTKQELRGPALQQFLLKKVGRHWDELKVEHSSLHDVDVQQVRRFISKAVDSSRMAPVSSKEPVTGILRNLRMLHQGKTPNHACLLSFGKKPQAFFPMATFKIGRFGSSNHDLRFQDVIEGNILEMPDRVMDVLRSKYLVSKIRYDGLLRIEDLEYPEDALREAILNAIVHKDYSGAFIQLSVYDDKLILWNPGNMPEDLPIEDLKKKHPSRPHNPGIASLFFQSSLIEAWGRGIEKMIAACVGASMPEPQIQAVFGGVQIVFFKPPQNTPQNTPQNIPQNTPQNTGTAQRVIEILLQNDTLTLAQLAEQLKLSRDTVKEHVERLKQSKQLVREGSDRKGRWVVIQGTH